MAEKNIRDLLYLDAPKNELCLEEFESFAYARIRFLHELSQLLSEKKIDTSNNEIYSEYLRDNKYIKESEEYKDFTSHWICLMAFFGNEDNRQWLIDKEVDLLRIRMIKNNTDPSICLGEFDVKCDSINENEFKLNESSVEDIFTCEVSEKNHHKLIQNPDEINFNQRKLCKVNFEDVSDLLRRRKVVLHKGFAIVPNDRLIYLVLNKYRNSLIMTLDKMSKCYAKFNETESERLMPIFQRINAFKDRITRIEINKDLCIIKVSNDSIKASDIKSLYKLFPLCMQQIFFSLKSNGHLRYKGRQQFGLFLKGIGLSMHESLKFWKEMFTRNISDDTFDKMYAYQICHNYGQVGSRKDYHLASCSGILSEIIMPNDCHGCPYRTSNKQTLLQQIYNLGISDLSSKIVLDLVKSEQYKSACTKVFELVFGTAPKIGLVKHPNAYFLEAKIAIKNQ